MEESEAEVLCTDSTVLVCLHKHKQSVELVLFCLYQQDLLRPCKGVPSPDTFYTYVEQIAFSLLV
jgi:hypothetical protein